MLLMQKKNALLAVLYLCLFACIFLTARECPILKYFSKGLKLMAMDYYCFIPREGELVIGSEKQGF